MTKCLIENDANFEQLKFSIDMVEELLVNAYYGMVLVNKDGIIVKWNYEKFFGVPEEDVLGKPVQEVIENTRLHIVVKTGKKEICQVQEINGHNVITSRIPIIRDGVIIGAIGTILFGDTSELQSLATKVRKLEETLDRYKGELSKIYEARYSFNDIICKNPRMLELKSIAKKVAQTNSTVLIQGESGTGKELFAHAIHKESLRRHGNFITLNCAAIPRELLESELFGYEEGAFTGARKSGKVGKFELAADGTILLDEIGSMPLPMQSKLLRVLEAREFERVGGTKPVKLSARIISATNEDLEAQVQNRQFRSDLYYRLNVIKLVIPPLRQRVEDIDELSMYIVSKLIAHMPVGNKLLAPETIEMLKSYHWPGNIRELKNVLERAINFAPQSVIVPEDLPDYIRASHQPSPSARDRSLKQILMEAEKQAIRAAIIEADGNRKLAAQKLGIHRTSLYKKMEKYELEV
ncbi:MAG: sigma-54-dependent Fis family transcriptional regulator [Firmicutes bacterium]|nr:sigma-54-dependent Fis family transcriptional regulator [Bacillota bacterium]